MKYNVEACVPHSAGMSLLTRIIDHSCNSLVAEVDIQHDCLFADSKGIPSWVGIEYMAQAIAAYAGITAINNNEAVKVGFLLGSRSYICQHPYFNFGETLRITVTKELEAESGLAAFTCSLTSPRFDVRSRLNVYQPHQVDKVLQRRRAG